MAVCDRPPFLSLFQFQKNTEHSNFSNSVVDVFTQLTQCFEVLQKLECQDPEIWKRYMKRFAKTVVKVLTAYADLLKQDFPNHVKNEATVSKYVLPSNMPHFTCCCNQKYSLAFTIISGFIERYRRYQLDKSKDPPSYQLSEESCVCLGTIV